MAVRPDSGPWPYLRGFTITLRHTTFGRTSLDEWSARIRDLYLTKHTTHKRQTSITLARYELAIPVSERPQDHALDNAITRIGHIVINVFYYSSSVWLENFQDNKFKQVSFRLSKSLSTFSWDLSSISCLRIEGLLSVRIKVTISWKSIPRCLTDRKQCLCCACCHHLQGRRSLYPEERSSWTFRNSGKYLRNFRILCSRKH